MNTNPFSRTMEGMRQLFKYNKVWGIILIVIGVISLPSYFDRNKGTADTSITNPFNENVDVNWPAVVLFVSFLAVVSLLVMSYTYGVMYYIIWKNSRKEKASLGDAFRAVGARYWTILAVMIMSAFRIIGGLLLLVVPGVRALLRYQLVLMPVFDENLKAKDAMARIKKLTDGHLIEVAGLSIVAGVLPVVGPAMQVGGEGILYNDLKLLENHKGEQPKAHWLNYALVVLMVVIAVVFIAVGISESK